MAIAAVFQITERGPTPRGFRKAFNAASKESWNKTGAYFHEHMRDARFTNRHATAAGYAERKKTYTWRKFQSKGHTRPLEYSGETRRAVRAANISSTSSGNRVAYPGARKFNFRHPKSDINMAEEFSRVTQAEANELAKVYDNDLDQRLNK